MVVGIFLWSNVLGCLFATLPIQTKLVKSGVLKKVDWVKIIGSIFFAVIVFSVTAVFLRPFFIGTLPAGVIMLFNIGKLRAEELEQISESLEVTE